MTTTNSYYELVIYIDPGGGQYHRVFKTGSLEEIKLGVIEFIRTELYLFCWYGCYIYLNVYHAGNDKPSSQYDLRSIIQVYIPRLKTIIKYNQQDIVYYSSENGYRYDMDIHSILGIGDIYSQALSNLTFYIDWKNMVIKANGSNFKDFICKDSQLIQFRWKEGYSKKFTTMSKRWKELVLQHPIDFKTRSEKRGIRWKTKKSRKQVEFPDVKLVYTKTDKYRRKKMVTKIKKNYCCCNPPGSGKDENTLLNSKYQSFIIKIEWSRFEISTLKDHILLKDSKGYGWVEHE